MPTIERPSGVRIEFPNTIRVGPDPVRATRGRRVRGRAAAAPAPTDETGALVSVLEQQEFTVVDTIPLAAAPSLTRGGRRGGRRATAAAAPRLIELSVPLQAGESAAVLLEEDGVFRWHTEGLTGPSVAPPTGRRTRGSGARSSATGPNGPEATVGNRITFRIELSPAVHASAPQRTTSRGASRAFPFKEFFLGKAKATVLKFAANVVGGLAVKFFERHVRTGLVQISSVKAQDWKPIDQGPLARLPADRPARALLFVHGTFSSTSGSYGALAATEWGRAFLTNALARYDIILGFDHPTLSVDPFTNASDMLAALQSLAWPHPPEFDVVAFSRGGLVFRSMVEQLLPTAGWAARFRRVAFVACTNGGTQLANPDNWRRFADLYTNIAVASARLVGLFPQAAPLTTVIAEVAKGLGAFVKVLAAYVTEEDKVPGLAAMMPRGRFIETLNGSQPGQPTPTDTYYCAITSDFEPNAARAGGAPELPPGFWIRFADRPVDHLFGVENDLVVHTKSMSEIDPAIGGFIKDRFDFGTNGSVYHTNYFTRPETVGALARWFDVAAPTVVAAAAASVAAAGAAKRRRTRTRARAAVSAAQPSHTPRVQTGAVVTSIPSAATSANVLVAGTDTTVGSLRRELEKRDPEFVVVRRPQIGTTYHYAFTPGELSGRLARAASGAKLEDTLRAELHEHTSSAESSSVATAPPLARAEGALPSVGRTVIVHAGMPVGVTRSSSDLPRSIELVGANRAMAAATVSRGAAASAVTGAGAPRHGAGKPTARRMRGRTRAAPPKASAATEIAPGGGPPKQVECHFRAQMNDEIVIGKIESVQLLVSRELLERAPSGASAIAKRKVDTTRKLVVSVIPRAHAELVGEDLVEIDVPTPNKPQTAEFHIRGVHLGEGEVWIQVRQGPTPLVTLRLATRIVEARTGAVRHTTAAADLTEFPIAHEPVNTLRIAELQRGNVSLYEFILEFPKLKIRKRIESKPITGDRFEYISALYQELERTYLDKKENIEAFQADVQAMGGRLYDELVPDEMQRLLWDNRDKLKSIQVFSTEPFIPWELLLLKEPAKRRGSQDARFLGEMGVVRWMYEGYPPEEVRVRKDRALYVIPEYPLPEDQLPEAQKEAEYLAAIFGAKAIAPTADKVYQALKNPGSFDLLHFACHGDVEAAQIARARLLMQGGFNSDGEYVEDYVLATTVEQTGALEGANGERPIVVLNACRVGREGNSLTGTGGFAQAFVRAGAGIFVGTLWAVGDSPARNFTEAFYTGLKAGKPLAKATSAARTAAKDAGDATWLAYVVYGDPSAMLVSQ